MTVPRVAVRINVGTAALGDSLHGAMPAARAVPCVCAKRSRPAPPIVQESGTEWGAVYAAGFKRQAVVRVSGKRTLSMLAGTLFVLDARRLELFSAGFRPR